MTNMYRQILLMSAVMAIAGPPVQTWGEGATTDTRQEVAAIMQLVRNYNKSADKGTRKNYEDQLKAHTRNWEAMFLAACRLRAPRHEVLLPLLAAGGRRTVRRVVRVLTWNPDASLGIGVRVTCVIGQDAIPVLVEHYKDSSPVLPQQYVVLSIRNILANAGKVSADQSAALRLWALKLAGNKDEIVAVNALWILHALCEQRSAAGLEPVLKAKLLDSRPAVRVVVADIVARRGAEADYVGKHVTSMALSATNGIERRANIRFCSRLPIRDHILNILYRCAFDKDRRVRVGAEHTLLILKDKSRPLAPKMLKALKQGSMDGLSAVLAVLKHSREDQDVIEMAVSRLLSSDDVRVRVRCVEFLTNRPTLADQTVQVLTSLVDDSDKQVRMQAVRSLYRFRDRAFVQKTILDRRKCETQAGPRKLLDRFIAEIKRTAEAETDRAKR